jgi:hypothetical protein
VAGTPEAAGYKPPLPPPSLYRAIWAEAVLSELRPRRRATKDAEAVVELEETVAYAHAVNPRPHGSPTAVPNAQAAAPEPLAAQRPSNHRARRKPRRSARSCGAGDRSKDQTPQKDKAPITGDGEAAASGLLSIEAQAAVLLRLAAPDGELPVE